MVAILSVQMADHRTEGGHSQYIYPVYSVEPQSELRETDLRQINTRRRISLVKTTV